MSFVCERLSNKKGHKVLKVLTMTRWDMRKSEEDFEGKLGECVCCIIFDNLMKNVSLEILMILSRKMNDSVKRMIFLIHKVSMGEEQVEV